MNQKSKKNAVALFFVFAAFCASVYSLASAASYEPVPVRVNDRISDTDVTPEPSDPPEEATFQAKVIRLWHGKAAVFDVGAETPEQILPADTESLPDDVISRLSEGIFIYTQEQYISYIEDFS